MVVAGLLSAVVLAAAADLPPTSSEATLLAEAEVWFRQGLQERGKPGEQAAFRKSALFYETLRQRGCRNAGLFLNLGNAYWLGGDLPRAILAYRHGLLLAPNHRELHGNLALARDRVVYSGSGSFGHPLEDTLLPWLPRGTPSFLFGMVFIFYILAWLFLGRWWMTRQGRFLGLALAVFVVALLPGAGWVAEMRQAQQAVDHPVVVIAEDGILLRKGNGLAYEARYQTPLNRGVETRQLFTRGDWLMIELAGGEVGWVPRDLVVGD